jgi:hypothetical protein
VNGASVRYHDAFGLRDTYPMSVEQSGESSVSVGLDAVPDIHSAPLILLGRLDDSLALKGPLALFLEEDGDGGFIVSDLPLGVYGEGPNATSALKDYKSALADFFYLVVDKRNASPEDAEYFRLVTRYLDFSR